MESAGTDSIGNALSFGVKTVMQVPGWGATYSTAFHTNGYLSRNNTVNSGWLNTNLFTPDTTLPTPQFDYGGDWGADSYTEDMDEGYYFVYIHSTTEAEIGDPDDKELLSSWAIAGELIYSSSVSAKPQIIINISSGANQ